MLCSICLQIFETYRPVCKKVSRTSVDVARPGKELSWHPDLASFENGLQMKCLICLETQTWLKNMNEVGIDGLKGCTARRSKSIADVSVSGTLFDNIRLLRLEICFWDSSPLSSPPPAHKHTIRTSARVELVGFDTANASRPMVPQSISPKWDESSRAQATQWYENCLNNHKTCNLEVGDRDYRPSRLLELNDSTGVKLVETRETVAKDPYVTLSHCWGGKVPLRLLEINIQDLKKEIPVDRLPKTFLEAIEVARRLQFRYLWIDSLCIVQDSEADWRHESTSMAEVYSNAWLNISATASRNGNGGLFPSYPFQFVADAWWTEDCRVSTHFIARKSWNKAIDEINLAPLSRRGWVLQERLLSPRVLHFAQKQMFWECEEVIYSQAFPAELCTSATSFEPLTKMSNKTRMLQSFNGAAYTHGSAEANEIYKSWEAWVEHYSAAAITKSSDKLVAISAVAKILGRVLNDTYVAGLWRGDMPRSLMWKRKPFRGPPVKRLEGKRAPTWSWAALDCLVDFEECLERELMPADSLELMQLIEIQEGLSKLQHGYDEAGRLIGGELRLRGGLYQVRIPTYDLGKHRLERGAPFRKKSGGGYINPDISFEGVSTVVMLLPIYWEVDRSKHDGSLSGLVLQPVSQRPFGWYERVGIFSYDFKGLDLPRHERGFSITSSNMRLYLADTENEFIII